MTSDFKRISFAVTPELEKSLDRMKQEFLQGGLAHVSEPRVLELLLFYSRRFLKPRGRIGAGPAEV